MASRGINKVILVGNLGNDPEHRVLPSGGGVTNISLATSESWRDKNTGDQQERTEWHGRILQPLVRDCGGISAQRLQGLCRGLPAYAEMAGSIGPGSLHHRDRRAGNANARQSQYGRRYRRLSKCAGCESFGTRRRGPCAH